MVEHEGQRRKPAHRLNGGPEVLRLDEQIEGQAVVVKHRETAMHVLAQQPVVVRLILHLMANSDQFVPPRSGPERPELPDEVHRGQVCPGHHPGQPGMRLNVGQEFLGFLQAAARPYQNRCFDAVGPEHRGQIVGQKRPIDRGQKRVGQPQVINPPRVDDMNVAVNHG